jgi:hypothetical protein
MYTKKLYAGWADMDFNAHMKNTAYLDKAADVRQKFLMEHGFPVEEFLRQRIGPVVMKDELEYFKEVGLQQEITVTLCACRPCSRRQPLPTTARDLSRGWKACGASLERWRLVGPGRTQAHRTAARAARRDELA